MRSSIVQFWNLMGSFASLQGHLPTIHTAEVIGVPESFRGRYFVPIITVVDFTENRRVTEPEFQSETIHVDVKMALVWCDDKGPFQLSTVDLGFGPRTNKIVHKPVKTVRYEIS